MSCVVVFPSAENLCRAFNNACGHSYQVYEVLARFKIVIDRMDVVNKSPNESIITESMNVEAYVVCRG